MSDLTYKVEVHFGTVELQERYIELSGWLQHQSRRIERDNSGKVTSITDWRNTGGRIKLQ